MTARYEPRAGLAWVEALDGGIDALTAWVADVATGRVSELDGTAWLIWVLLGDGARDAAELRTAAAAAEAGDAFDGVDLEGFLEQLAEQGLVVRVEATSGEPV